MKDAALPLDTYLFSPQGKLRSCFLTAMVKVRKEQGGCLGGGLEKTKSQEEEMHEDLFA